MPSIAGLASYHGKARSRVYEYKKLNEEFKDTLEAIQSPQECLLVNKGLIGDFNVPITKPMLSNHGYSEKQEIDHQSSDGTMSPKPTRLKLVSLESILRQQHKSSYLNCNRF